MVEAELRVFGGVADRHLKDVFQVRGNVRDGDLWLFVGRVQNKYVKGILHVPRFVGIVFEPLHRPLFPNGILDIFHRVSERIAIVVAASDLSFEVFLGGGVDDGGRQLAAAAAR